MKRVIKADGFRFAGIHAGIKVERKDLALIVSDLPANAAGVFTQNRFRAPCVDRSAALLPTDGIHAIVVNSGNANVMGNPEAAEADQEMAEAVAAELSIEPTSVLTASTGSIGVPLAIPVIVAAVPKLVASLEDDVHEAAEAILTTDLVTKVSSRSVTIGDRDVRITAIAKGSGMIHPNMATMLAFLCTDASCQSAELEAILKDTVPATFNQVSVDRDTSTNDMVIALANGATGATVDRETTAFVEAVREICEELARAIAADGEGATRLLTVTVKGAPDLNLARALSRAVVSSNLFKASLFGDHSGWGRCLAAIGAHAAELGFVFDRNKVTLSVNGVLEADDGIATGEQANVSGPEVRFEADLAAGDASATAWGCDLSYDYVSINAVTKADPLRTHSPGLKRRLLVEALSYIKRFTGKLAVIKYGGAAMLRENLMDAFAEDVVLLRASGLLPVVVHGGGPEISRTLERLGEKTRFVDGMRVTDQTSMKIVEMVLTGSVNTDVVTRIHRFGGDAIGLSGKDGALLTARKLKPKGADLGMVGEVEKVRTEILTTMLDMGYIPVISPVGVDKRGVTYNINADSVAAEVAVALNAEKILFLTDVPGILDEGELVQRTTPDILEAMISSGVVKGGMVPKTKALLSAVRRGVPSGHIIDGRVPHNLLAELFTDRGVGTWIRED